MASSSHKRRWLLLIPLVVITAAVALHFHRLHQSDSSPIAEQAPWALETARVQRGSVSASLQSAAVVEAPQSIVLSAQIPGTVLAIGPRAGVAVKRGELLARIDARTISSNIAALSQQRTAALADATYAGQQRQRTDALLAEGGVSQAQADQARTAADGARAKVQSLAAQIDALRVQLGYAEVRAPQDAVVAERLVEAGDTVAPGKPLYRLTAGKGAVVRVSLAAAQLARVHVGDMLELQQGSARISLPIRRVAPAVNAAGLGSAEADASAAPFGLPSGSLVMATVHAAASASSLTVPTAALVGSVGQRRVVVFAPAAQSGKPGSLRWVPVQVLQEGGSRAAVSGSLQPGEQVVVAQTAVLSQLRDGDAAVTAASAGAAQ
jgi:RND family efflux transporter MFP subunit